MKASGVRVVTKIVVQVLFLPLWYMTAHAGVVDSPVPTLQAGAGAAVVFTATGVVQLLNLETVFMCTSLERTKHVRIGVEVFGPLGGAPLNDVSDSGGNPGNGAVDLPPGGTATIVTGNTAEFLQDETILFLPGLKNGSARILSTSSRITCNAFLTDKLNTPPNSLLPLRLLKGSSQKGD